MATAASVDTTFTEPERPAHDLDAVVAEVVKEGARHDVPDVEGQHLALTLSHALIRQVAKYEADGWSRDQIVARLKPARAIHAESPFIRRLQQWPRGYPGDFESVEYLLQQRNQAPPGRLSYWLEQYALDSPIAQQHRNKVELQARAILEAVLCGPTQSEPRILILAAGGSPDLRQIQSLLARRSFTAVLLDQDADALAFSAQALPLIRDRLVLVNRSVVRGLMSVRQHGPFNLVLAGGLFDYLPDSVATLVLRQAREHLLGAGGRFVFTNIVEPNPYRRWIEYLGEWHLIHRTDEELRGLCRQAGFDEADVSITTDRTGLARIVQCQ